MTTTPENTEAAIHKGHSNAVTEGIRVRVAAQLVPEQSDPQQGRFLYVYRVILTNEGDERAKLLGRHWIILDADNERRDVRGSGVVGEHPDLAPGESFQYQSSCQLATRWGTMEGSYLFERPDGRRFEAAIGRFFLAPNAAPISALS
ncbi:MAG: Co2+/Mg2+ efflux protein ApaG [Planctomycetes bacterium]|nr:Co2+/Mg2+ efflux protein ApaG [Planctomycetota bacterium]